MGKRKCNSKYRTSTPSQAEDDLTSPRNNHRNADLSPESSGSSNRAADLRPLNPAPAQSRPFEVSDSPDNLHSPYHLLNSDHPGLVLFQKPHNGQQTASANMVAIPDTSEMISQSQHSVTPVRSQINATSPVALTPDQMQHSIINSKRVWYIPFSLSTYSFLHVFRACLWRCSTS
ncbi:hypothetical protein YC2023_012171 [Brassica napus]